MDSRKILEVFKTKEFGTALYLWWKSLQDNRGQRAELCRCRKPEEVYISAAFRDSWADGDRKFSLDEDALEALALPIGVLAHARTLETGHFAKLFAQRGKGSPAMRDVRFRRLMEIPDDRRDELFTMLVRFVRLMDDAASPQGLLDLSVFWNDLTRVAWAKAYYPNRTN
ncbi:MAG: type I-E CRISPR-associated protein Cse2/CasB [bacterium]|nr:type I-E CRISPR-associated protein Cse2/CasB [bacterium]